ncbi:unnamed protein product [Rhizophagus irregularis]|nr:unnamed protein product [Rhizophagus irregularis]
MDNEQQPTNRTINATQIEHAPCDFSDTTSNNSSSYASLTIRRRRNQRRRNRQNSYMERFEYLKYRWQTYSLSKLISFLSIITLTAKIMYDSLIR